MLATTNILSNIAADTSRWDLALAKTSIPTQSPLMKMKTIRLLQERVLMQTQRIMIVVEPEFQFKDVSVTGPSRIIGNILHTPPSTCHQLHRTLPHIRPIHSHPALLEHPLTMMKMTVMMKISL